MQRLSPLLLVALFYFTSNRASVAQHQSILPRISPVILQADALKREGQPISKQTQFYYDTSGRLTVEQVQNRPFRPLSLGLPTSIKALSSTLWFRFSVSNPSSDSVHTVLTMGRLAFIQLYLLDEQGHTFHTQQAGTFAKWPPKQLFPDGYGLYVTLPPGGTQTVWVAVRSSGFFKSGFLPPRLYAPNTYRNLKEHRFLAQWPLLAFYAITIGFLLFGAIFTLFQYVIRRSTFLLAYTGVAFLSTLMVIRLADYNLEIRTLSAIIPLLFAYLTTFNFGIGACYLIFIRQLLRFDDTHPGLDTWTQYVALFFGCLSVLCVLIAPGMTQSVSGFPLDLITLSVLSSILVLCIMLATVLYLFVRQVPLSGYLLAGWGCIALGTVGMVILNQFPTVHTNQETFWQVPSVYMSLGMIGEMLCFSLALGERARCDESERLTLIHRKQVLESEAAQLLLDLQQAVREAEGALLRGQSEERRRVAGELHDLLGGTLTAIRFRVLALNSMKLLPE